MAFRMMSNIRFGRGAWAIALVFYASLAFAYEAEHRRHGSPTTHAIETGAKNDAELPRARLAYRPPLDTLQAAAAATGAEKITAAVALDFDAKGIPTSVELIASSGYPALDAAIVEWTKQVRLPTGMPGRGSLPFSFEVETTAGPAMSAPVIKKRPSLRPVMNAMARTNLRHLNLNVLLEYDAEGRVTSARILERTPSASVEKAVLEWVKNVVIETDRPGAGQLPFAFEVR